MQKCLTTWAWSLVFFVTLGCAVQVRGDQEIALAEHAIQGEIWVEQAIRQRRSVRELGRVIQLETGEQPLYILPLGKPR